VSGEKRCQEPFFGRPLLRMAGFQSELRNGLPKPMLRTIRRAFLYRIGKNGS